MAFRKDVVIYKGKKTKVYICQCYNKGRKTKLFAIRKDGTSGLMEHLGVIRWHGAWRQYVFVPDVGTIWNVGCLNKIAQFLPSLKRRVSLGDGS